MKIEKYNYNNNLIGTNKYNGIAYFWSSEYKHILRDFSSVQLIKVHYFFIKNNLVLNEKSRQHQIIINIIKNCYKHL